MFDGRGFCATGRRGVDAPVAAPLRQPSRSMSLEIIEATVSERCITGPDGRTWTFRLRADVRKDEASTHVTLVLEAGAECRVVSCPRVDWESEAPDLAGLLARALPGGASRNRGPSAEAEPNEPR
jgi:hypothetical protein